MKIKICGITHLADAQLAQELGADYIGLIFAEQSPRFIEIATAKAIVSSLKQAKPVGVFVENDVSKIEKIAEQVGLYAVQVYSDLIWKNQTVNYWQALRVKDQASLQLLNTYKNRIFVLDAYQQHAYGGTGKSFDWSLLPKDLSRVFLAGGINPENVMQAQQLKPYGIDVCSGVESSPGKKDHIKLQKLFAAIRGE